jgi:inorganic pyrophosphatase
MNHHSSAIETFASPSELNVIIETPKGSRNKYKYDEQIGIFRLHKMLTAGAVFPLTLASCRLLAVRMAIRWTSWC